MDVSNQNIVLIGMPGSGKSTIGVLVAKALGMDFLDVDLVIQQQEGKLLQELVDELGPQRFLDLEEDVVCALSCSGTVIAPGGSAVCRAGAARHLKQLGTMVYLHLPCEALIHRLSNMATRGIAMEPGQTLQDIYDYHTPIYQTWADVTVDAAGQALEETAAAVLSALHAPESVLRHWPSPHSGRGSAE